MATCTDIAVLSEETLRILEPSLPIAAAYIFGSHVSDGVDEDSDVDIAIFTPAKPSLDFDSRSGFREQVASKLGHLIELHFFDASDLTEAHPASFAAFVLKTGVRIEVPSPVAARP